MRTLKLNRLNEALQLAEARIYEMNFGSAASVPMKYVFKDGSSAVLSWDKLQDNKWKLRVLKVFESEAIELQFFHVLEMAVEARIEAAHLLPQLAEQLTANACEDLGAVDAAIAAAHAFVQASSSMHRQLPTKAGAR